MSNKPHSLFISQLPVTNHTIFPMFKILYPLRKLCYMRNIIRAYFFKYYHVTWENSTEQDALSLIQLANSHLPYRGDPEYTSYL